MNEEKTYWKWKSTIIDFNNISDEKNDFGGYISKKDMVFQYLGTPDNDIHEWYNGGWSSEYNEALRYAKQLGLVEDYIDYEEIRYERDKYKEALDKIKEIIKENFDMEINDVFALDGINEILEEIDEKTE